MSFRNTYHTFTFVFVNTRAEQACILSHGVREDEQYCLCRSPTVKKCRTIHRNCAKKSSTHNKKVSTGHYKLLAVDL